MAWIAGIVAVAALVVGIAAYNNDPGENLGATIQDQFSDTVTVLNLRLARLEAAAELTAARIDYEADENFAELKREVEGERAELADEFRDAGREASQEWRDIEQRFDDLETDIRNETNEVLSSLNALIDALRQNVATDNE